MAYDFFGSNSSVFRDLLDTEPRAGYFAYQNQFGRSPAQRKYYQGQFSQMQDRYLGQLGQQIMGGNLPTLRFADYLRDFDWQGQYAGLTPSQRGAGSRSQFAPQARWLF